jgi:ubiquinol-cytochrome c reductase cytochrome c1 subunit
MMIRLFLALISAAWLQMAVAQVEIASVAIDLHDKARLQRGATLYMNYCSGCHSLRYMRYNRMAKDLGLTTFSGEVDNDLLVSNLIFTSAEVHDPIRISMPEVDARQWFGRLPPDLSLSARERGPDWIYTYLKSFYADSSRPFGANNALVPDVAMPNVLGPLAGIVVADSERHLAGQPPSHLVLHEPGEMSPQQFDSALQDLVTFLVYVGEPAQLVRYKLGFFVLLFLCVFLVFAYQLKRSYWRNIGRGDDAP